MRQDTGTFRAQDCYYLDGTPGPMQLGSGPGSVHFASGDQTIEPQQASSTVGTTSVYNPGSNRPIDRIVDGARCWCPNAAAVAVVSTTPMNSGLTLTTQNRATVRNSYLSSGAPTSVVNVANQNSTLSCQLYLENTDIDGWFQDASAAGGITVAGTMGPAILSIGRNVRVLNAANQAMSVTGNAQVFMSDDFLAGQPQIDRVMYRSSSPHTSNGTLVPSLGWAPMPNALIASQNSVVAGEFQAPAPSPIAGASGSALQIGQTSSSPSGTRVRARLTYIPDQVYALFMSGGATYVVLESITATPVNTTGATANGIELSSTARNVNINSLHFETITGSLITKGVGATYFTNTGDIWGPPGASNNLTLLQSSAFTTLVTQVEHS